MGCKPRFGYYPPKESGWYYLQSRYYDPIVKRFLNADDYASTGQGFLGINMFAYCDNNPIDSADTEGSSPHNVNTRMTDSGQLPGQTRALIRFLHEKYLRKEEEKSNSYVDKATLEVEEPYISEKGIGGGILPSASKTHIEFDDNTIDANMLAASADTEISFNRFGGKAGVYLSEVVWTFKLFGDLSLSLGGSIGVAAQFESSFSGIVVGTSFGIGFVISLNWGVLRPGITSSSESYERTVK